MRSPVKPFVRTPYNYDAEAVSLHSGLTCLEPTLAQQQFKEEVDINTIAAKFGITGQLPVNARTPSFGDYTDVSDFHTAMNAVRRGEEAFMQMPGLVRERFEHDPQRFLEFCADPANKDEAVKLGLAFPAVPISATIAPPPEAPKPA